MRSTWIRATVATLGLALGGQALAQAPPTTMSAFDTLEKEFDAALKDVKDYESFKALYEQFQPRFETVARTARGTDPGLQAELWALQYGFSANRDRAAAGVAAAETMRRLIGEYPASPKLADMAQMAMMAPEPTRYEVLEELAKRSSLRPVQATAKVWLGRAYGYSRDEEMKKKATAVFEDVLQNYANEPMGMTTAGVIADAQLNPHAKDALANGKPAPEIVGIDANGKPMTLSKFRGRVVLLDFWGDW